MTDQYVGYHGTSLTSARHILKQGFTVSSKENEWLGQGIYFFGSDGSIDGQDEAMCWARYVRKHSPWAVVEGKLKADKLLDMVHNVQHRRLFDQVQEQCFLAHMQSGKKADEFSDCVVFNDIDKLFDFEMIIAYTDGAKNKFNYNSYVVRRLQIQICVKLQECIVRKSICSYGGKGYGLR